MKSIGLRATPTEIWYTISESLGDEVTIKCSKIIIPKALEFPEKLNHIRTSFKDIIREEETTTACIRITESNAQNISIDRISIEAVLQELFCSSNIERYLIGNIASISKRLGFKPVLFKKYTSKELEFETIPDWHKYNTNQKESILSSLSALTL